MTVLADNVRETPHVPVMLREVLTALAPRNGEVYVDGTFGAGGHTRALLESAECKVIAMDRDPTVRRFVGKLQERYGERLIFLPGRFGAMDRVLEAAGVDAVDGILLDLGASSMQFDTASRGFSFAQDGPLDMRMEDTGRSAADLVNNAPEEALADIIYTYGGERMSRRIARAIVREREREPIVNTLRLAEIVRRAAGKYHDAIHPATRTFQAIRIWVNDELGELERALESAAALLAPGGRLVIITFHSGEDAIVKQFLSERSGGSKGVSRHLPDAPRPSSSVPAFALLTRKAVKPSAAEIEANPRARSAKLRAAKRIGAMFSLSSRTSG